MQQLLRSESLDVDGVLQRHAATVYRLAYARARSAQDAEDIFQEVFLRYVRKNPRFQSEEHEKAWFIRVTVNYIKSYYTTAEKRHAVLTEVLPEEKSFVQDDFELMLLALPEEYRVEVHLFYGERMSVRQIAHAVGKSENAVRVRLTRARQILRKSLQGGDRA